jgi:uncharacterized membrane protein
MATTFHTADFYSGPERRLARGSYLGDERRTGVVHQGSAGGMESRIKLFGHPVHQQLVSLPIGLLVGSVIFDLVYLSKPDPAISTVAFWMLVSGLVAGALAAPFGLVDWLGIPKGTRAKRIGLMHALGNVTVLLLFCLSAYLRGDAAQAPPTLAIVLSIAAVPFALLAAWLGGELVSRLGVGISAEAGLDAASSMDAAAPRR